MKWSLITLKKITPHISRTTFIQKTKKITLPIELTIFLIKHLNIQYTNNIFQSKTIKLTYINIKNNRSELRALELELYNNPKTCTPAHKSKNKSDVTHTHTNYIYLYTQTRCRSYYKGKSFDKSATLCRLKWRPFASASSRRKCNLTNELESVKNRKVKFENEHVGYARNVAVDILGGFF